MEAIKVMSRDELASAISRLPGTQQESEWLRERLETLSVKESVILTAALQNTPPQSKAETINHLFTLQKYDVCFPVDSYKQLAEFYMTREFNIPQRALPYTDLDKLGKFCESKFPGQFVENCYVVCPSGTSKPAYDGSGTMIPEDTDWSVKLKLSSPTCPEGVWLRLPDYECSLDQPDELALALHELKAESLSECTIVDARCVLPEAGNLTEQYSDAAELVRDGNDLGYILDEQSQGMKNFWDLYAAALEYEGCRDLRLALDIAQNLGCYEWKSTEEARELAGRELRDSGVESVVINSGCIDLDGFGAALLKDAWYVMTADERWYVARNSREFVYERSEPGSGHSLIMG